MVAGDSRVGSMGASVVHNWWRLHDKAAWGKDLFVGHTMGKEKRKQTSPRAGAAPSAVVVSARAGGDMGTWPS